ncbi:ABC transporter permease [Coprobacter tertius]|uniref:ABC transporter permease n=1 Tax=Coprobacter tertius TaxID=2944915 RepID=A0ABT1MFR4_9BACT|nr:ABC transporter permease [Coprobacter tertius]MCP9611473.1 ABC transporter permease [Coprobacter tertius]
MKIVWKLLRQHISIGQFTGYFLANLAGIFIVLLSLQCYYDISPFLSGNDSLLKNEYLIISKKVNTFGSLTGSSNRFSKEDIEDLKKQSFAKNIGAFTPGQYNVSAGISLAGHQMDLSTQMFFEAVPDEFVDTKTSDWQFVPHSEFIPIILPKNYLNLYNFGFAQSRNMPQISEGLLGMVTINIRISGNGKSENFRGNIVGFSNRLNTILVPESFIRWSNREFGNRVTEEPSRLIVEVANPADEAVVTYLQKNGYEVEGNNLDAGKTNYFLKLITGLVATIGLFISVLSFFILMLSIYLLLQKNTDKLKNLLLIGYSPAQVSQPYQLLTVALNTIVLIFAGLLVYISRIHYIELLSRMWPSYQPGNSIPTILIGIGLLIAVSVLNAAIIRQKINRLWKGERK